MLNLRHHNSLKFSKTGLSENLFDMLSALSCHLDLELYTNFVNSMELCSLMKDFRVKKAFGVFYFCLILRK